MSGLLITIEHDDRPPLNHPQTLTKLLRSVNVSSSLYEAAKAVDRIPGLSVYIGDSHVAVHPTFRGKFAYGSDRLAIITEARS